jgi:hypothetical protein
MRTRVRSDFSGDPEAFQESLVAACEAIVGARQMLARCFQKNPGRSGKTSRPISKDITSDHRDVLVIGNLLKQLAARIPPACCKNGAFVDSLWLWRGSDRQRAGDLLSYDRRFDLEEFSIIRGVPPHRTGFDKVFAGDPHRRRREANHSAAPLVAKF